MPNDDPTAPPDEWLNNPGSSRDLQAPRPTVDEVSNLANSLSPDDRLRLVTRLWKSLPRDHRAALVTLQIEHVHSERGESFERATALPAEFPMESTGPNFADYLFDRGQSTGLYSAPRRFDLASIFVVTAAYSILLGSLSMMGAPPLVMVVVAGMIAIIATTQAMFLQVANPRGVSIVTGVIAFTIICWIILLTTCGIFPNSFFIVTFFIGIPCGGILGYLLGTLVGGVFLVADLVRGKFERRGRDDAQNEAASKETARALDGARTGESPPENATT